MASTLMGKTTDSTLVHQTVYKTLHKKAITVRRVNFDKELSGGKSAVKKCAQALRGVLRIVKQELGEYSQGLRVKSVLGLAIN